MEAIYINSNNIMYTLTLHNIHSSSFGLYISPTPMKGLYIRKRFFTFIKEK